MFLFNNFIIVTGGIQKWNMHYRDMQKAWWKSESKRQASRKSKHMPQTSLRATQLTASLRTSQLSRRLNASLYKACQPARRAWYSLEGTSKRWPARWAKFRPEARSTNRNSSGRRTLSASSKTKSAAGCARLSSRSNFSRRVNSLCASTWSTSTRKTSTSLISPEAN